MRCYSIIVLNYVTHVLRIRDGFRRQNRNNRAATCVTHNLKIRTNHKTPMIHAHSFPPLSPILHLSLARKRPRTAAFIARDYISKRVWAKYQRGVVCDVNGTTWLLKTVELRYIHVLYAVWAARRDGRWGERKRGIILINFCYSVVK